MKNKDLKFSDFKSLPKILLVIFLIIFILQIFILLFLLIAPLATQAAKTHPMFDPAAGLKKRAKMRADIGKTALPAAAIGAGAIRGQNLFQSELKLKELEKLKMLQNILL